MVSVSLFRKLHTQWRVGMSGAYGLDYNVVFKLLDRHAGDAWDDTLDDIQILEEAALAAMKED